MDVTKEKESYENNKNELVFLQDDIQKIIDKILSTLNNKNSLKENESKEDFKILLKNLKQESDKYYDSFGKFIKQKDPFFQLIFSSEGAYAEKEKMDNTLESLQKELIAKEKRLEEIEKILNKINTDRENLNKKYNELSLAHSTLKQESHFCVRNKTEKEALINNAQTKIEFLKKRVEKFKTKFTVSSDPRKTALQDE